MFPLRFAPQEIATLTLAMTWVGLKFHVPAAAVDYAGERYALLAMT